MRSAVIRRNDYFLFNKKDGKKIEQGKNTLPDCNIVCQMRFSVLNFLRPPAYYLLVYCPPAIRPSMPKARDMVKDSASTSSAFARDAGRLMASMGRMSTIIS